MEYKTMVLFYFCSFSGLVMVVGGMFLIYKEKIYIDRESQQVTEIETPIGKFRSNAPALVLFVLGFVPLIYPIWHLSPVLAQVHLRGSVSGTGFPVHVYAVARAETLLNPRDFELVVPKDLDPPAYTLLYVSGPTIFEDRADLAQAKRGELRVQPHRLLPPEEDTAKFVARLLPVPREFQTH